MMPPSMGTMGGGAGTAGGLSGFFQKLAQLQQQDPMQVLGDPNAGAMNKLLAVLMNSKFQMQGPGGGFGFQGPGSMGGDEQRLMRMLQTLRGRMGGGPAAAGGAPASPVTTVGGSTPGAAPGLASLVRPPMRRTDPRFAY